MALVATVESFVKVNFVIMDMLPFIGLKGL